MDSLLLAAQENLFMSFQQSDFQYLAQIASHVDADRLYRYDFAPAQLNDFHNMDDLAAKIYNIFSEPEPKPDTNNEDPCPPR
jgi:hypothetical protein